MLASSGWRLSNVPRLHEPQTLFDFGLVFEVAGALVLAVMENSMAWPDSPIRGSTVVAAWIALCVLVIPNRPWKSVTAALLSAAMVPAAHLLCAHVLNYAALPWNRLASYTLSPLFIAAWTPFLSARIYQMQKDLEPHRRTWVAIGWKACWARAAWARSGARAIVCCAAKPR